MFSNDAKRSSIGLQDGKISGIMVIMKKNAMGLGDVIGSLVDWFQELVRSGVVLQLFDSNGKHGKPATLKKWMATASESAFKVTLDWNEDNGVPGAFSIKNNHRNEFYLKSLTLEDVPGQGRIYFLCNSWVYPSHVYEKDRIFFTNKTYIPTDTPEPLRKHREEELLILRGDGKRELKEWDRVYDYDYYNDLGNPDKGSKYARPVLGGSTEYPYPRRGRTGRPTNEKDMNSERRVPIIQSINIYVPRDERFSFSKLSDAAGYGLKSGAEFIKSELELLCDNSPTDFESFDDVLKLYENGIKLHNGPVLDKINETSWKQNLVKFFGRKLGAFKYPLPQVINADKFAWRTDEEFAREMLAGVNPIIIRRLEEFPPTSMLDPEIYGNQNSKMLKEHIEDKLNGLTIHKAIANNRLFILDHHDVTMQYLRRINDNTTTKTYATRTILFLQDDGTLKPLAIELSLPHPNGDRFGFVSQVYIPAENGVQDSIWQLAKAYVVVNDSGVHQIISHWLKTHATIEPFIIATNRQLSVVHPIHKLLHPHFRDTMNVNALARQILINAGGGVELTVFPRMYAMEMSSAVYKTWVFNEQALPEDLKKRGIAVEDPNSPHGLRLLIKDYPYVVDGLEIWSAIKTWVREYCWFYYENDEVVEKDTELQSWWKELREVGHGDKKDEPWWPQMKTLYDLIQTCTIIIWIASALHAAINFGQYPYGGYFPNRPAISRLLMPEKGTPEYSELEVNPDKTFLKTITSQLQSLIGISLIEILSNHTSDEVYLGQRDSSEWTTDEAPLKAFERFGKKLKEIEEKIIEMNNDEKLKNRVGPVKMPYTLLCPTSETGMTGRGIPNSVSI